MKSAALVALIALLGLGIGFYVGVEVGESRGSAPTETQAIVGSPSGLPQIDTSGLDAEDIRAHPWKLLNQPLVLRSGDRMYRSSDGGQTWTSADSK